MPEIIKLCICDGGYDLCPHCLGSGVIIIHEDEYISQKGTNVISKKKDVVISKPKISQKEKVDLFIRQDDFIIIQINRFQKKKKKLQVRKLKEMLLFRYGRWMEGKNEIKEELLKVQISEYLKFLKSILEKYQMLNTKTIKITNTPRY